MDLQVFVENCNGTGFRATCLSLPGMAAEGATREEALSSLHQSIKERFSRGELTKIEICLPGEAHPLAAVAGILKDHPLLEEWEQSMAEYRRQVDADPDRP